MTHFVYLEFADKKLSDFLTNLRAALWGERSSPVHITVRGPYKRKPNTSNLEALSEEIKCYGVLIGGADMFETSQGYVAYLKVQSKVFSDVGLWWKKSFPKSEFGVNPHITMFESTDLAATKKVVSFLRAEKIEIFTLSLYLSVHASKQISLFDEVISSDAAKLRSLVADWKIKPGVIQRAKNLASSFTTNEGS